MPEAWQVSVLQTAYFLSLRQQLRRDDMMGQYIGNYYPGISHCFSLFRKKGEPGMFAAAYYNEISWDQNKRPSKNFKSYG